MKITRHPRGVEKTDRPNLPASAFCLPAGMLTWLKTDQIHALPTSMTLVNIGEQSDAEVLVFSADEILKSGTAGGDPRANSARRVFWSGGVF